MSLDFANASKAYSVGLTRSATNLNSLVNVNNASVDEFSQVFTTMNQEYNNLSARDVANKFLIKEKQSPIADEFNKLKNTLNAQEFQVNKAINGESVDTIDIVTLTESAKQSLKLMVSLRDTMVKSFGEIMNSSM
jgi:flagellar hook-basal body complex protein FliE